jgi:hypothetical protein
MPVYAAKSQVRITLTMVVQEVTHGHQSARHSDLGQEPGTVEA